MNIQLDICEMEILLTLLYRSKNYNNGGRLSGILVEKLEQAKRERMEVSK